MIKFVLIKIFILPDANGPLRDIANP